MLNTQPREVYATTEQLQRLAALSLDALVGIQFATSVADNDNVTGCYVPIDNPNGAMVFFEIQPDGSYRKET